MEGAARQDGGLAIAVMVGADERRPNTLERAAVLVVGREHGALHARPPIDHAPEADDVAGVLAITAVEAAAEDTAALAAPLPADPQEPVRAAVRQMRGDGDGVAELVGREGLLAAQHEPRERDTHAEVPGLEVEVAGQRRRVARQDEPNEHAVVVDGGDGLEADGLGVLVADELVGALRPALEADGAHDLHGADVGPHGADPRGRRALELGVQPHLPPGDEDGARQPVGSIAGHRLGVDLLARRHLARVRLAVHVELVEDRLVVGPIGEPVVALVVAGQREARDREAFLLAGLTALHVGLRVASAPCGPSERECRDHPPHLRHLDQSHGLTPRSGRPAVGPCW